MAATGRTGCSLVFWLSQTPASSRVCSLLSCLLLCYSLPNAGSCQRATFDLSATKNVRLTCKNQACWGAIAILGGAGSCLEITCETGACNRMRIYGNGGSCSCSGTNCPMECPSGSCSLDDPDTICAGTVCCETGDTPDCSLLVHLRFCFSIASPKAENLNVCQGEEKLLWIFSFHCMSRPPKKNQFSCLGFAKVAPVAPVLAACQEIRTYSRCGVPATPCSRKAHSTHGTLRR